jgi:hypothetical protein
VAFIHVLDVSGSYQLIFRCQNRQFSISLGWTSVQFLVISSLREEFDLPGELSQGRGIEPRCRTASYFRAYSNVMAVNIPKIMVAILAYVCFF